MHLKLISVIIGIILLSQFFSIQGKSFNISDRTIQEAPNLNFNNLNINEDSDKNRQDFFSNIQKSFIKNCGQLNNDDIKFYTDSGNLWFTDDGVWFEVREEITKNSRESSVESQESRVKSRESGVGSPESGVRSRESNLETHDWRPEPMEYKRVVLKQEFVGSNQVRPVGREQLNWYSNFFYGNDSSKWRTEVPNYKPE